MLNFPFTAVLLAGGLSRRMGRDKALVEIAGEVLWKRQLIVLRQLNPTELFICGRPDKEYEGACCDVITDLVPDRGPMGGLHTALKHASTDTLLLLAVDMPAMKPAFLQGLLDKALAAQRSIVPKGPNGVEPLAAVYRAESRTVVEECLSAEKLSMRTLIMTLEQQKLVELYAIPEHDLPLFANVNTPEELAAAGGSVETGGQNRN
ncbi:MAG: molybdenum cofactor guanylyltransferase [Verrucomicrobiaceae bacterium]|nr:MAG: molybdenum cofactor guanylyltransferase [Verrucomicrobiaceae bacterium]